MYGGIIRTLKKIWYGVSTVLRVCCQTVQPNRKKGWCSVMNFNTTKLEELLATLKKKEEEKDKNTVLWVLAIIGAVAAVAGIAFAVYRFFAPDYLEDFEEDFDDDFDDYFEDEEE